MVGNGARFAQSENETRKREKRKKLGLCTKCGKKSEHKVYCSKCGKKARDRARRIRANAKSIKSTSLEVEE